MYRIAVVTSDIERDWASRELLEAANHLASGGLVDPLSFGIRTDNDSEMLESGDGSDLYDAYLVRGFNRQGEIDFQYEVFELLERHGNLIINSTAALSIAESKAQTTFVLRNAGLPVPRTLVTQDLQAAIDAVCEFKTAVVKPLYGSFGLGIEKLEHNGASMDFLRAFLDKHGVIYVQEYIPNEGRDIRAFVVGDDIPAAMYRVANEGQWKTNVYQGSSCQPVELTPEIRELCLQATHVIGLDYTGVDVMEGPDGPVILELNGAPSWHGLSETTDRNIAIDIVGYVLEMLDAGRSAQQPSVLPSHGRTLSEHATSGLNNSRPTIGTVTSRL